MSDVFKVLQVNDPHISDFPPESRRDKFPDVPLNKVEQVLAIAKKYEPDLVMFTGDHFHFKHAERTKYGTTKRYSELVRQMPGFRRTIIGNHDVPYDRPDRWIRQPLAYMIDSGALSFLGGDYELNEETFQKGDLSLRFKGIHYYKGQSADDILSLKKGDEDWLTLVCHMDLFPKEALGYEGYGVVHYEDIGETEADVILNGHIHDDLGVREQQGTKIVNVGNLLRGSIAESDLSRTPKVAMLVYTKESVNVFELPLSVSPPHEVFEVVKNQTRKAREREMKEFVSIFGESERAQGSEIFDPLREMDQMDLDPPVRRLCEEYIDKARAISRS